MQAKYERSTKTNHDTVTIMLPSEDASARHSAYCLGFSPSWSYFSCLSVLAGTSLLYLNLLRSYLSFFCCYWYLLLSVIYVDVYLIWCTHRERKCHWTFLSPKATAHGFCHCFPCKGYSHLFLFPNLCSLKKVTSNPCSNSALFPDYHNALFKTRLQHLSAHCFLIWCFSQFDDIRWFTEIYSSEIKQNYKFKTRNKNKTKPHWEKKLKHHKKSHNNDF